MVFLKNSIVLSHKVSGSREVTGSERRGQSRAPYVEAPLYKNSLGESDWSTGTPNKMSFNASELFTIKKNSKLLLS